MKKGIESLKAAVLRDTNGGENCFSEKGCTKVRFKDLPQTNPGLIEMGMKTKCVAQTKCMHDYCGKYQWVLERAKHYSEKTGKTPEQIIEIWETDRSYWYMNYYQEANQPLLEGENIMVFEDWEKQMVQRFGEDKKQWAFLCPSCGQVQSQQTFIDHGAGENKDQVHYNCIGRYVEGMGCKWTLGGFLQIHKTSILKDAKVHPVFEMAAAPQKVED